MKFVKAALFLLAIGFGSASFAECSVKMNYNDLVDCIINHGASDQYKETLSEASDSTTSKAEK